MRHCQGELQTRSGSNPRETSVARTKAGGAELSKPFGSKVLEVGYGATGFGVCPDGFQSSFGLLFPHCALILPSGMVMYIWFH